MWTVVHKRWRAWLRAVHRDFGYVAVGFTVIYALSGLAINHISDWDPNFRSSERTLKIAAIPAELPDDEAVKRVTDATGTGKPDDVFRAGDEIRLTYSDGTSITAIGGDVTIQARSDRFFLRVANWLHYNRGKQAWTYVADVYAVMLLYLAISGIFMIKGRLGLKWRGAVLISLGVAVPLGYVVWSGGPNAHDKPTAGVPAVSEPSTQTPAATEPADDEFARPRVLKEPPPDERPQQRERTSSDNPR
ncbi:MAG: PepSY-associated TM helix domain-containing protein [Kofleriaceae bacterium]